MKSTKPNGSLRPIEKCYLFIPNYGKMTLNNLPDISDSKSAVYNEESVIGRSSPIHTYSFSGSRQISINFHFFIIEPGDAGRNLEKLRALQSCVYPRENGDVPYIPPVVCTFRCGDILATQDICLIMENYSFSAPTEVAWDEETLCPYKFDVNTSWKVVYTSNELPFQSRIIQTGYK